jgi:hypothetical protein
MNVEKAIKILNYEILMLRDTYDFLKGLDKNTTEYNVYLESFLNHASCLYEFFYEDKKYKDDIRIEDFSVKKEFKKNFAPIESFKQIKLKTKRDKQLAHITRSRIKLEASGEKSWSYGKIYELLDQTIKAFVDSLPEEEKEFLSDAVKGKY